MTVQVWLFHFWSSFLFVCWEAAGDGWNTWVPVTWETQLTSMPLALAWLSPSWYGHLGNEPAHEWSLCLQLSNKKKKSFSNSEFWMHFPRWQSQGPQSVQSPDSLCACWISRIAVTVPAFRTLPDLLLKCVFLHNFVLSLLSPALFSRVYLQMCVSLSWMSSSEVMVEYESNLWFPISVGKENIRAR